MKMEPYNTVYSAAPSCCLLYDSRCFLQSTVPHTMLAAAFTGVWSILSASIPYQILRKSVYWFSDCCRQMETHNLHVRYCHFIKTA